MKRWLVLFIFIIMSVASVRPILAVDIETHSLPPQALIIIESNYQWPAFTFTPKIVLFIGSDFQQPWMYASFKRGRLTGSIGMVLDYRELSGVAFAALKVSQYLQPHVQTKHEFHLINHDNDFFYWGLICREFATHSSFLGLYWELSDSDATRLQIGPHVGIGDFELNLLFGEHESNIRATWIIGL